MSSRSLKKTLRLKTLSDLADKPQQLYPGLLKGTRVMLGKLGKTQVIKSVHRINNQELYKLRNKPANFLYKLSDTATHDFPEVVKVIVKKTALLPVKLTQLTLKKAKAAAMRRRKTSMTKNKSKSKSRSSRN